MDTATRTLALYQAWFGPPPGEPSLTVLEIEDGYGSQADVTTIIQAAPCSATPRGAMSFTTKCLTSGILRNTDVPSSRWNEGLASFREELATESLENRSVLDPRADQILDWLRQQLPANPDWSTVPMRDYGRKRMTDLSCSVGMLLFNVLYRVMGDTAFLQFIREYSSEYTVRGVGLRELQDAAQRASTVDLSPVSRDWVETAGWSRVIVSASAFEEVVKKYAH